MRTCGLRRRSVHTRSRRHPIFKSALAISLSFALCSASFADVLVNLDSTGLANGPLATWTNTGTISSNFTSAGNVVPQVTTVAGVKGVSFILGTTGPNGTHYIGPVAPPSVAGSNPRTIEAWVYNPNAQKRGDGFRMGSAERAPRFELFFQSWHQRGFWSRWTLGSARHWLERTD
jgi:hypothetical protein